MSFTYPGKTEPTLYNINFHVEPGEIIALCGLNGSGKSTFAHLITRYVLPNAIDVSYLTTLWRLYDYDDGRFTINDVDVRQYDAEDLHEHTTVVFQNFSRYNTTLRENVGVGQIDLLDKDTSLREALRAGGGARLLNLPNGLDTNLEYSGFDFSFPSPFPPDPLGFGGVGSTAPDRCALSGGEVGYDPLVLGTLADTLFISGNGLLFPGHLCDRMRIFASLTNRAVLWTRLRKMTCLSVLPKEIVRPQAIEKTLSSSLPIGSPPSGEHIKWQCLRMG